MNTIKRGTLIAALVFGALAWTADNANARERHHREHFRDFSGWHHHYYDRYGYGYPYVYGGYGVGFTYGGNYWVDGHYETRTETVLTNAEHYEQQSDGTVTSIPASYETRDVRVWVPGYWAYR